MVLQTQPPKIISLALNCIQQDENPNKNVISVSLAFHACHLLCDFFPPNSCTSSMGGGEDSSHMIRVHMHGPQTTEGIKHTRIYIESRFVEIRGHSKKGNKRD